MVYQGCQHPVIDDDEPYCGQCRDEFYIDTPFTMNDVDYVVWQFYGDSRITGESSYQCRRVDGNGAVYLTTSDIDQAVKA